ncbi:hypothetical protein CASFOL_021195 [Castilleja foliolosa]|uniref:QWRF motif-containing protein 2 n=1 Tax=Castilleja foliolosa TaxID=1961234 RepID=A0ABD3CXU5_9LAMI
MVNAILSNSSQRRPQNPKRTPSFRSDSDVTPPRRPKSRDVSSRYLSLSTSSNSSSSASTTSSSFTSGSSISTRRSQTPTLSQRLGIDSTPLSSVKERSVSAERRRPTAAKTIRSLSVSFQGESFSLPLNKVKQSPEGSRKGTPVTDRTERDRENSRPNDQQHRWPGRLSDQNPNFLCRSFDCGAERGKLNGSGNELIESKKCTADENSRNKGLKFESNNFDSRSNNTVVRKGSSKQYTAKKFQNDQTRTKNGVGNLMKNNHICSTPSMLSFAADVRRRKLGESRIMDAHKLRILHNRHLQWRLANTRVENALLVQEQAAERSIYNACVSTWKLRHSVTSKRTEIDMFRHNLKLYSIIKEQELHLENWDQIDRNHWNSLSGIINALEASTVRLPVVGVARVNVQKMEEAITSAIDVMQAMASSICSLQTKVEQTNSLVSELSNLSLRECDLLDEIKDYLSTTFIPLQLEDPCIATSSNTNEKIVNVLVSSLLLTKSNTLVVLCGDGQNKQEAAPQFFILTSTLGPDFRDTIGGQPSLLYVTAMGIGTYGEANSAY